ncbi:hypothetical protein GWI33_017635 [Rhynchophorus ferrugineus]|uniref:NADH dehydrogenase [ubiquinone] 1 alpha subcomplex subunit 6 n=1 Tax=Rhynchophorus ferrugineus TaxID=354439 RepID=A0A834HV23_RHYFE|nr:hypothetical protein GWI33_017635 [Rhynchophorus ferrugineus]
MSQKASQKIFREVRPILSLDHHEARNRVISLYKSWFRQIPYIMKNFDTEFTEKMCKNKLREEFTKYGKIKDIRVIDMLIIKGKMDLEETKQMWITGRGIARYFGDATDSKPASFLGKFIEGKN